MHRDGISVNYLVRSSLKVVAQDQGRNTTMLYVRVHMINDSLAFLHLGRSTRVIPDMTIRALT